MTNLLKKLVLATLLISVMYSCEKDNASEGSKGDVNVKLTDAPFPFSFVSEANVGIAKIELKNADGEYVVLFETTANASYNLLDYTNGATASVTTNSIAAGTYTHAKVTLSGASVVMNGSTDDGSSEDTVFDFNSEANGSYEIAIEPQLEVEEGEQSNLLFDVDVNETFSFTTTGIFDGWFDLITQIAGCSFDPAIRVCDLDKTGTITGTLTVNGENYENAHVSLVVDGDTIAAHTKADGTFTFIGIKAGTYEVEMSIPNEGVRRNNVTVTGTGTVVTDFSF